MLFRLSVISEKSESPTRVSWEKNAAPIIRVTSAWKIRITFAHLMIC